MSEDQAQEPLTTEEQNALKSWSNVGAPGPAPTTRFIPDDEQLRMMRSATMPKRIAVDWHFDDESYRRLQFGHEAHEMEDKWDVYMVNDTVYFHRSWTGVQIFALALSKSNEGEYVAREFMVEQNPEIIRLTDEREIEDTLLKVLRAVMRVSPESHR